jgi:isopropylmalate/homocitrate/citramalate synthase
MQLPTDVRITEVGPRDGLQNEPHNLPTAHKIDLIRQLAAAGCQEVEATAFVSPKAIPNLADAAEVMLRPDPQRQGLPARAGRRRRRHHAGDVGHRQP